ncbi:hypothetical protein BOTBODRAFT_54560 [Botryobasidium botryosum FD-172 SS1]|uniref:Uncharacterized protein n=1 Tax=Botryobasidium botryosum (strain FD-172 SS1) TaxID=930990 RepID=A0A067MLS3_BOTB1|nr:hypothetical protein BOTBODRAFT_54560 [Botryobasidium botryosum FD-172 SS1]
MFLAAVLFCATFVSAAANFSLTTPQSLAQCSPSVLNWAGGQPPYTIMVYPSCTDDTYDGSDTPLDTFTVDNGTSITWTVNVAAQKMVQLVMVDAGGNNAYSDDVMIGSYNSTSCLNQPLQIAYSTVDDPLHSSAAATATTANKTSPIESSQNSGSSPSVPGGAFALSLAPVLLAIAAAF